MIKNYLFIIICSCSLGCSRLNNHIKIEQSPSTPSLKNDLSTFCMPIDISIADIEKIVNEKIIDKLIVNNKGENNTIINVKRAGHINLTGENNKVLISLPIKVTVKKTTKINQFVVDFTIDLIILSKLEIASNWQIISKSKVARIVWRENPKIDILGMGIDIKGIVDKELNEKKINIEQSVDAVIRQEVNLKKQLDRIWFNMQKPHNIIKKTGDEAFLFIEPTSIYYQSHHITKNNIIINIKSEAEFTLLSSYKKDNRSLLPNLIKENTACKGFNITMLIELKFKDINAKINKHLKGKSIMVGGYNVSFKKALIHPSGQNLYVRLAIEGQIKGTLAGLVSISIDTAKRVFFGTLNQFEVINGDIKLELANLILGDFITNEMSDLGWFDYYEYLNDVPIFIQDGIESGKSGDRWHPVFDNMNAQVQRFEITDQSFILLLNAQGKGRIKVDQLKFGQNQTPFDH